MLIIYIGTGSFYVYTYEHFHTEDTEDTNINKESFLSKIENMFLCYNSGYDIIFIGAVPRFLRGGDIYGNVYRIICLYSCIGSCDYLGSKDKEITAPVG